MIDPNLEAVLRSLPRHDADPRVADRIRRRALDSLRVERSELEGPWQTGIVRLWTIVEPIFSTGIVSSYLLWMVWTIAKVAR